MYEKGNVCGFLTFKLRPFQYQRLRKLAQRDQENRKVRGSSESGSRIHQYERKVSKEYLVCAQIYGPISTSKAGPMPRVPSHHTKKVPFTAYIPRRYKRLLGNTSLNSVD